MYIYDAMYFVTYFGAFHALNIVFEILFSTAANAFFRLTLLATYGEIIVVLS